VAHPVKNSRWTKSELAELRRLCSSNTLFMSEIAEKLGRAPASTRWKAHRIGVWSEPEGRFAEWNRKHQHLHEAVLRYFRDHTYEETAKHFGLTEGELKSCFAYAYRNPKFKHIRKDDRRHDAWTAKELLFLARHAGIQPRAWIAKKLKRGTDQAVKEALSRAGVGARYINGMPISWAVNLFGEAACGIAIATKAGPQGLSGSTGETISTYQLIPWIQCEELLEAGLTRELKGSGRWKRREHPRLQVPDEVRAAIRAMANFQRWIHGVQSSRAIRARFRTALNGGIR
jgi:hypothetical protein